ncbi:serine O-acetyltransferase [Bhargavaea beijingensis]|uniref:Serine acetyltransferase n=1 Tax=Bhargavaea beijingensis TaxID=426756 RepID=A0A1G6XQV9_9BACL|nr:serine O-acetyltransferase [Bhargavaea beijingensis]MCW1928004.1 serine O-acetyltransferase [Bhargavaea beijingensis]RSK25072.1 serine O-acetyltransferase [Bhargavaea beijingensis]SDD80558.1 serine O-acetyltransferase [Bhargavaea beijingensis]
MFKRMKEDISTIFDQDPSARSSIEIVLTYAGLHAIWGYRVAHFLHTRGLRFLARVVSQFVRFLTGIEIHPGAVIGRRFFIDHGSGVVIGETCVIGDDVTLYQGVTLGGTGKEKGKRHPTLGNNVLIASGAKVLGSITLGDNVKVGAGSVVLKDVPPNSTVVGIPGTVVVRNGVKVTRKLDHQDIPDPVADKCDMLEVKIKRLNNELERLQEQLKEERR